MRYEIYQTVIRQQWRWRFVAANGRVIAVSSEGYANKADCLNGIRLMQESASVEIQEPV